MQTLNTVGGLILSLAVLTGCGSKSPEPVNIKGTVLAYDGDPENSEPVELVQVCQLDQPTTRNCDTTDANGEFELELPGDIEATLTLVKEGFGSTLVSNVTDSDIITTGTIFIPTEAWLNDFAAALGIEFPECEEGEFVCENAIALITTRDGLSREDEPIAGVSYELLEGEGEPYYLDDNAIPDTSLDETQASGVGGFFNMPEIGKTHEVRIDGAGDNCGPAAGWPGKDPNTVRFPVLDKFVTQVTVVCD